MKKKDSMEIGTGFVLPEKYYFICGTEEDKNIIEKSGLKEYLSNGVSVEYRTSTQSIYPQKNEIVYDFVNEQAFSSSKKNEYKLIFDEVKRQYNTNKTQLTKEFFDKISRESIEKANPRSEVISSLHTAIESLSSNSPSNGAYAFSGSNTTSEEEDEEDKKRRQRLNISAVSYIPLKFVKVDSTDKSTKEYVIQDDSGIQYAKEQYTGEGFKYENIQFTGDGPLEIKIPCSFKMVDGKKEFSKECDVLYFDNQGKLIGYEKGNSKETQLNKGWLKGKLGDGLGLSKEDQEKAMNPGYSKSNFVQQTSHPTRSASQENTNRSLDSNNLTSSASNQNNNEENTKLKEENERLKNENAKLREENEQLRMSLEDKDQQIAKLSEKVNLYNKHETKIKEFEEAERIRIERENFINENIQKSFSELITMYNKQENERVGLENDKELIKKIIDDRYEALKEIKKNRAELNDENQKNTIINGLPTNAKNIINDSNFQIQNIDQMLIDGWKDRLSIIGINENNHNRFIRILEKVAAYQANKKNEDQKTSETQKTSNTEVVNGGQRSLTDLQIKKVEDFEFYYDKISKEDKTDSKYSQYKSKLPNNFLDYNENEINALNLAYNTGTLLQNDDRLKTVNNIIELQNILESDCSKNLDETKNKKEMLFTTLLQKWNNLAKYDDSEFEKTKKSIEEEITFETELLKLFKERDGVKVAERRAFDTRIEHIQNQKNEISTRVQEYYKAEKHEDRLEYIKQLNKKLSTLGNNKDTCLEKAKNYISKEIKNSDYIITKSDNEFKVGDITVSKNNEKELYLIINEEFNNREKLKKYTITTEYDENNKKIQLKADLAQGKTTFTILPGKETFTVVGGASKITKGNIDKIDDAYKGYLAGKFKANWESREVNDILTNKDLEITEINKGKTIKHKALFHILEKYQVSKNKDKIVKALEAHLATPDALEYKDVDGKTLLGAMIENLPIDEFKKLITSNDENFKSQVSDNKNTSLIQYAIEKTKLEHFNYLIGQGFPINEADNEGNTPLKIAIKRNNKEIVEKLIAKDVELPDNIIETALSERASIDLIEKLIIKKNRDLSIDEWTLAINSGYDLDKFSNIELMTEDNSRITILQKLINKENSEDKTKIIKNLIINGLELTKEQENSLGCSQEVLDKVKKEALENPKVLQKNISKYLDGRDDNLANSLPNEKILDKNISPTLKYLFEQKGASEKVEDHTKIYNVMNLFLEKNTPENINNFLLKFKPDDFADIINNNTELAVKLLDLGASIDLTKLKNLKDENLKKVFTECKGPTIARISRNETVEEFLEKNNITYLDKLTPDELADKLVSKVRNDNKFAELITSIPSDKLGTVLNTAIKKIKEKKNTTIKQGKNSVDIDVFYSALAKNITTIKDNPGKGLETLQTLEGEDLEKTVNYLDQETKNTLLKEAIEKENIKVVTKLIKAGVDPKTAMKEVISYLIKEKDNQEKEKVNDFVRLLHDKIVPKETASISKSKTTDDLEAKIDKDPTPSDRWPPKDIAKKVKDIISSGSKNQSTIDKDIIIMDKYRDPKKSREI